MSLLLKECRWCGNSFVPAYPNDAYCSGKCRAERRKEKSNGKKAPVFYRKTRKLSEGVPTIPDVISATLQHRKKTGKIISYGKMVAIMEGGGI